MGRDDKPTTVRSLGEDRLSRLARRVLLAVSLVTRFSLTPARAAAE